MSKVDRETLDRLVSNRNDVLRILVDSSYTRRDLIERIECAESTLDRGLRGLENANLVEYVDGEWQVTYLGICAYRRYDAYTRCLADLADATPVLAPLDRDSRLSVAFIAGCDAYESGPAVPDSVLSPLFDSVRHATAVRGVVPKALLGSVERFYENATTGDPYDVELCFADGVFEHVQAESATAVADATQDPNVSLFRGSVPFPFGLWIVDDAEAGVVIYTETGIRGTLVNDTDDALIWATEQYESVKRTVEPVS